MIKLFDNGAYLLNGTELVEDNAEAGAVLASKLEHVPSKEEAAKILWHMVFWKSIIHQVIWII